MEVVRQKLHVGDCDTYNYEKFEGEFQGAMLGTLSAHFWSIFSNIK